MARLYDEKYRIAAMLQPKTILEIGVRAGYSAAAFLSACPATYLGLDADLDCSGGWLGAPQLAKTMLKEHFGDRARIETVNTQELQTLEGRYDLAHVDGDHSYEGALHDLRLAAGVTKWILVDDIDFLPDVGRAVADFLKETGYSHIYMPTFRGDCLIQVVREKVFSSDGDLGDTLYSLPTVKMLGGGKLILFKAGVREPYTPEKVDTIRPLLERQPYITSVEYADHPSGLNLQQWRSHYKNHLSICDMVSEYFGVGHYPRCEPWLSCSDPLHVADVVVHRSPRYHGPFCWSRIAKKYKDRMVFIGHTEEHRAWQAEFGQIPYYHTPDWWEVARVISGAQVFVGGQSAPLACALGLCKTKIVCEQSTYVPNTHFDRVGPAITCYYPGSAGEIPDLNPA